MTFKQKDEKLLKNNIINYKFDAYPFEEIYKNVLKRKAKKEPFIRISSAVELEHFFFNFKLQTPTQTAYFKIEPALGDTDFLWNFLENICIGKEEVDFLSEQEGPNSLLVSKKVDEKNIRLILICDIWVEHYTEERKIKLIEKCFQDCKPNVLLDTIINKKDFVYTLYCALRDIFINDNYDYIKIKHIPWHSDYAQADSLIIRKYLGYVDANANDMWLLDSLYSSDIKKVKSLLKFHANPNAMVEIDEHYRMSVCELFFKNYWRKPFNDESKIPTAKQEKTYFDLVKILISNGAKPRRLIDILQNGMESDKTKLKIIKYLFDNNCFFDYFSMSDCSFEYYSNNGGDFYKKVLDLSKKYLFSWFLYTCDSDNIKPCIEYYKRIYKEN